MSVIKASDLSELLKDYNVDVSPKNIGRFTQNYGIKKDPDRPSASGFYVEPSEKQLKKIASQYEKNILKAPGSKEAGKEAFEKRKARAIELLTQGYNQTEADNILKKEFNISMKSTLTDIAKDLRKEGVKIISGRESEVKTPSSKFSKERRRLQGLVSDAPKERLMAKLKREAGYGDIDLSHRLSMKQNEILGTKLISSNLGLDPKKVNREIVKPIENKLNKIFNDQIKVVDKIKKEGTSLELRKELEGLNKKVTDIVEATDRRLQGILIDEITLKPKQYGVNYATSFGAGVIPDKPISQLTKQEIELAIKQIPGQLKAIKKEPSLATRMSNQVAFGPSGMEETGKAVIEDVKGIYGKYAPQIARGALTGLQVLGTPAVSAGLYATDVAFDLKEAADEGNLTAKKALDAFVGQGEKGLYFFLPELAKDIVTSPIVNKILQLGKIGRFATPTGAVLSTVGVAKDFYDQYKEFQALSPEEKEKRIKESIYTPTEQDILQMQEAESRASAAIGGRINFAGGSDDQSKEGGFVEFGDPETWDEKFSEFTKRAVHSRPVEKIKSTIFGKYADQITETRLKPTDPLSKYKSYSEEELAGNIEAKRPNQLQSFSLEDYQLITTPIIKPKDIVPKGTTSTMPNIYNQGRKEILELATGGIASMFRERPGYQEGGFLPLFVTTPSGIEFELFNSPFTGKPLYRPKYNPSRDLVYYGIDPEEFFKTVMTTGISTPTTTEVPTIDPFSDQPYSKEQYLADMSAQAQPSVGSQFTEEGLIKKGQDDASREQAVYDPYYNDATKFATNVVVTAEVPTIDPFSGQTVSAQDQLAFTQPQQDIFPQQELTTVQPKQLQPEQFQPYQSTSIKTGIKNLYGGDVINQLQDKYFGGSGLSTGEGIVSDLRHATATSQLRDKIAEFVALPISTFNQDYKPGGIAQLVGNIGAQTAGLINEINPFSSPDFIPPIIKNLGYSLEDLKANYQGATQIPYGQTATQTYNQLRDQYLNRLSQINSSGSTVDSEFKNLLQSKLEGKTNNEMITFAKGGRVGFKDGPEDPSKRKFIKGAGIVGLVGLGAKYIPDLISGAKKTKTAVKLLPKVAGMPDWFNPLFTKIIREGTDVPLDKTVIGSLPNPDLIKVKELKIVSPDGKEKDIITMMEFKSGQIQIESSGGAFDDAFTLSYNPPRSVVDVTGKKVNVEGSFNVLEQRPYAYSYGRMEEPDIDIRETVVKLNESISDIEKLKAIATGKKIDPKEILQRQQSKKFVEENPSEDIVNRYGDSEIQYDRMKDEGLLND